MIAAERATPVRARTPRWTLWLVGIGLFGGTFAIYWNSVPDMFNTVAENRRFFDSDGEFIVRQYRQDRTFTHNDHLLYHVVAKFVQENSTWVPGLGGDPVRAHKLLSTVSGALAVSLLYWLGAALTGRGLFAAAPALLLGGCAGWWFFSATVDTYMPHVCASVGALGLCLLYLRNPSLALAAGLGGLIGLAALLRTDGVLLLPLALVLLRAGREWWKHGLALGVCGLVLGVGGYFALAHGFYDVPWGEVPAWALNSLGRPEQSNPWGRIENLSGENLALVGVNHGLYTVALPDLDRTGDARVWVTYTGAGWGALLFYLGVLANAVLVGARDTRRAWREQNLAGAFVPAIVLVWIASRVGLFTWWNPYDPFLFAVMSLPALWLLLVWSLREEPGPRARGAERALVAATLVLWLHNLWFMILPLRAL